MSGTPSNAWAGLGEGLSVFAKMLFESQINKRREALDQQRLDQQARSEQDRMDLERRRVDEALAGRNYTRAVDLVDRMTPNETPAPGALAFVQQHAPEMAAASFRGIPTLPGRQFPIAPQVGTEGPTLPPPLPTPGPPSQLIREPTFAEQQTLNKLRERSQALESITNPAERAQFAAFGKTYVSPGQALQDRLREIEAQGQSTQANTNLQGQWRLREIGAQATAALDRIEKSFGGKKTPAQGAYQDLMGRSLSALAANGVLTDPNQVADMVVALDGKIRASAQQAYPNDPWFAGGQPPQRVTADIYIASIFSLGEQLKGDYNKLLSDFDRDVPRFKSQLGWTDADVTKARNAIRAKRLFGGRK
jgi:hypothetical protein